MRGQPNYTNVTAMGLNGIPPLHLRVITSGQKPVISDWVFLPYDLLGAFELTHNPRQDKLP
jgi:hypothetical protein